MKYSRITISPSGYIRVRFISDDDNNRSINLNHNSYKEGNSEHDFIDPTDFIEPDVLCHFDRLLFNSEDVISMPKFQIIKNKGIFIENGAQVRYYCNSKNNNPKQTLDKILIENKTRLYIPSITCDIDFKIGDPIIYANWENPEDMLIISSVDNFEYSEDEKQLYILSTSLNKQSHFKIPYINFNSNNINIGVIRKVESQYGDWKSGDKIKANSTGITNFPKKDTNTIIAFINDGSTKYPLALCSNLCTLWMNEDTIMKFDRFSYKTKQWNKFENAPIDLNKIKWQHGDNFKGRGAPINFLAKRPGTKYSFEYHHATSWGNIEWGTSIIKEDLNEYQRHGFVMPRISASNPRNAVSKTGFPNMLGGYMLDVRSRIHLKSEQFKEDF